MKTKKLSTLIIAALFGLTEYGFAQESILASAIKKNKEKSAESATTPVTPVEAGVEEVKEEEEKTFTLSGSVDAYFHTSFGSDTYAPATSFANLNGFGLGMVNLIGSYSGEKVGFTADLVFGPRGKDAVFANQYTSQSIINQLFVYYKVSDVVTFNIGQFNTFLGYEVISPTVNFHYSTSYMFSYGPFNHTGLRADFAFKNGMVAKLAIMNPTDLVEFNPVNTYTLGGQIGYANDAGGIWFNVLAGDQDGTLEKYDLDEDGYSEGSTFQADITTGWNLSDKFYLGANATYRTVAKGEQFVGDVIESVDEPTKGFLGFALYPKVSISESFALGVRAEYFAVQKGYIEPIGLDDSGDGSVIDITLSANYKVGGLTIIPEFRIDSSSENSFLKDTSYSKSLSTFTLAAVYKF
ncbi:MAG: porin [Cyclobacteriaceae bacterium]|nr:porin [Cyclobacteriaceae bacterium]